MTETLSCEIPLGEGRTWRGHVPVLRLSWSDGDPLAVVVVVGARPPHPSLLRGRWVVLRDALRALLELPFDHLLFAHGDPVVGGGKAALRAFAGEG